MNKSEIQIIESMFPKRFFERGKQYFRDGRVVSIGYNRLEHTWFAEVAGSQAYYVEVKAERLHEDAVESYCDCPAYAMYHQCKHIVAVLLELSRRNAFSKNEWAQYVTKRFIEELLQHKPNDGLSVMEKAPMQVAYHLKIDYAGKVYLSLKTGLTHRYVVHHIRDLLGHVLQGSGYYFTKKFSYDPSQHYFLQQDLQVFQMLANLLNMSDFFAEETYAMNRDYDRRELPIPPLLLQDLCEQLATRSVTIEANGQVYPSLTMVRNRLPSSFQMAYNEEQEISLSLIDGQDLTFLTHYEALFKEGCFYFPTREQWRVCQTLWEFGLGEKQLEIHEDEKNIFFSEVLPLLKNVSDVTIDQAVAKEVVHYPLRAKFYLEEGESSIIGKLVYHYGTYRFDPFDLSESTDKIVIRDMEKEDEIMHLIEQSNFRYNGENLSLQLANDDAVYNFLYHILPLLDEKVELYLTEEIRSMIVEEEPIVRTSIDLSSDNRLLTIDFDISQVELAEVDKMIQAVIEKKRYYKLESGALLSLENEAFRSLQAVVDELDVEEGDLVGQSLSLPIYQGLRLDDLLETEKRYAPTFRKLLDQLRSPEEQVYQLPAQLQADLRSYQETGFQWFKSLSAYRLGGILADDMGLGKTVQAIAYLLSESSPEPHLVVVPSSVVYNWRNEFAKFAPSLDLALIFGSKEERQRAIAAGSEADVWITSYGSLRQDIDSYRGLDFHSLILDEAQYIKNYRTKTSQAVRQLRAKSRFALTGTPIENSLQELWSIFQVILPGLMPKEAEFNQWEPAKVAQLIKPFMLRRLKDQVLKELPEKIESVHVSQLTAEQKALYLGYLRELQEETAHSLANNQFQENRMKILAGLTRLRQLCCHPSLFIENYTGRSGKLDALMESIQTFLANGQRLLIFSQFTSMHELIIESLQEAGLDYFYLHGQTPAEERVAMSEAFNAGEKDIFLISLRAGGTGLNLTGADTVILFDLWWNPAVEDQAAGRAHRFGQKKVVQVIRFIAEGTIEERIYDLQQEKRALIDQVIQPGETMLQSLSEDEIRRLLNM